MQIPNKIRLVDHTSTGLQQPPLHSFAFDDTFCRSVGTDHSTPIIRTWVHDHTVVLGIQDSRLPYVDEGIEFLKSKGYTCMVRNSGGLAVVLDPGILNLSLIVKEEKSFSIDAGYEMMYELIESILAPYTNAIVAKEIVGSYCPGKYDLSINGKKFAGISQRRVQGGVAVQIYLCVSDCGIERAQLIKDFYTLAKKNEVTKIQYPDMVPETMASLSQLLDQTITVPTVNQLLLEFFIREKIEVVNETELKSQEQQWYQEYYERIIKRNEKFYN